MKKTLILILMTLTVVSGLSAADWYMGFSAGYDARINNVRNESIRKTEIAHSIPFANDHLIAWDRKEFALSFSFYGDPWVAHPGLKGAFLFGGDAAALWKKDVSDSVSILLGGGAAYEMSLGDPSLMFVDVFGNFKMLFEVMPEMSVVLDYKGGYDVLSMVDKKTVKTNQMNHKVSLGVVFRDFH